MMRGRHKREIGQCPADPGLLRHGESPAKCPSCACTPLDKSRFSLSATWSEYGNSQVPFCLVFLVCKIFLSSIVHKILQQQRRWSLAFIGPVNSNRRTQIETITKRGKMFANQYPTYLLANASISAASAEL